MVFRFFSQECFLAVVTLHSREFTLQLVIFRLFQQKLNRAALVFAFHFHSHQAFQKEGMSLPILGIFAAVRTGGVLSSGFPFGHTVFAEISLAA